MSDNTTEFICDVVRIKEVTKHPNADKLDVVHVEGFSGDIVCGHGDWKVGDLAVHIGPDAMVPLNNPAFSFLGSRLDAKKDAAGQLMITHYRLKMAKIRGLVSYGILIPITSVQDCISLRLGDSVAAELDVLKYETPAERSLRQVESVSIYESTLYQRIIGRVVGWLGLTNKTIGQVKRKIPDYSVVNLRKVPGFFRDGEQVEVTEKIHGANIRFGVYDNQPYIASHHSVKSDHRVWWQRLLGLNKPSKKHYYSTDIWTTWVKDNVDFDELPDNTIFYGEIFGKGVQDFEYGQSKPSVRVFDIWFVEQQRWASLVEKAKLLEKTPFTLAPLLYIGSYDFTTETLTVGNSTVSGSNHIREGIVIKSTDGNKRAKLVSDAYKMR